MGGSESTEFMVRTDAGEDHIAVCGRCDYAANVEKAASRLRSVQDPEGPDNPEEFPTPGVRTIDDLAAFAGGASADRQIKTLAYVLDDKLTLVLIRGDQALNETKLAETTGATGIRPAHPDEIREALGAFPGSLGAVGVTRVSHPRIARVLADESIRGRRGMTTGANRDDFHLRGVSVERDIQVDLWADLRMVTQGEGCPKCDGSLDVFKAVEIGHIFKLGTRYSESMGARVLTPDGQEVSIVMGSYGIGVERLMAAAVELYGDENGIVWPAAMAPFQVIITPVNVRDALLQSTAERIYQDLAGDGVETLLDDRDERAGVKFNDADLIGVPLRVTIGNKAKQGKVELVDRATKKVEEIEIADVTALIRSRVEVTGNS
jgi:prolyl-tRNA synthetase